jgi:hypothetical protein
VHFLFLERVNMQLLNKNLFEYCNFFLALDVIFPCTMFFTFHQDKIFKQMMLYIYIYIYIYSGMM